MPTASRPASTMRYAWSPFMPPAPSLSESRLEPSRLWVAAAIMTAFIDSGQAWSVTSICMSAPHIPATPGAANEVPEAK